jgi:hypothetical protein
MPRWRHCDATKITYGFPPRSRLPAALHARRGRSSRLSSTPSRTAAADSYRIRSDVKGESPADVEPCEADHKPDEAPAQRTHYTVITLIGLPQRYSRVARIFFAKAEQSLRDSSMTPCLFGQSLPRRLPSARHACGLLIPASTFLPTGLLCNNFGIFSELLHDSQRRLAARSTPEAPHCSSSTS